MSASLRLSGLTEMEGNGSLLTSMNFETPFFVEPETSRCNEWREDRSRFPRVAGLNATGQFVKVVFSWPRDSAKAVEGGIGLPESGDGPKTRFSGLFGDMRDRDRGRVIGFDRIERTESFMFGLNGVAVVWSCGGAEWEVGESGPAEKAGVAGVVVEGTCSKMARELGVGD